jgi:hypothetical protein
MECVKARSYSRGLFSVTKRLPSSVTLPLVYAMSALERCCLGSHNVFVCELATIDFDSVLHASRKSVSNRQADMI